VSQALTRLFLDVPLLGGLLWLLLHGADWALTILGELDAGRPVSLPQLPMRTNLLASALLYANAILVLGFAAALTGDPWLVGGVFGLMLLGGKHLLLGLSTR
jgi:hypothetical protein